MKRIFLLIPILILITSCTFSPKPMEGQENKQEVNENLVCTGEIEILPISINGSLPPKESFDYSMNIIKKYTSSNMKIHDTIDVTLYEEDINNFINSLGRHKQVKYLSKIQTPKLKKALDGLHNRHSIVMVYTPDLICPANGKSKLRGYAFPSDYKYNVVAYNSTTINAAPVISDVQAWKIVLTHEIGHRLGVPASVTHNKAGHCNNRDCVMYAKPDLQAVLSVLTHGMPYDFCDDCKLELKYQKESCGAYSYNDVIYEAPLPIVDGNTTISSEIYSPVGTYDTTEYNSTQ